ncbi:YihY family inner membrane protein [Chitinophaga sp. SYP-B3965]|uniref:YihY/virulence factor BrkB family protein n=1 Tax=Chitinophaga sp. SYP-B3965 TaxID=2663120 RepID=UPI001299FF2D|nr:YihY/virulence factor BrkB family protein [Chitinophaga sp. SYP-B3965]MRG43763.1 YihY family inner membrane protein [Chitinophaga sp. SYP-B3965]
MNRSSSIKRWWEMFKCAGSDFIDDKILKLSASLAYSTVFSIAPMIIIALYCGDIFLGREAIEGKLYGELSGLLGPSAAGQVQEIIKNTTLSSDLGWSAVIGFITLIIGATGVFTEIQDSINLIWRLKTKPKKGKGLLKIVLTRLLSFSLVISLGFVMVVSLVIHGVIEVLMTRLSSIFPFTTTVVYIINLIVTFITITALFAVVFKVLPDAKIKWRHVWVGAMTTTVLFMLGKFAIGFYLGSSSIGSTYGAAGSLVILLVWVYYSAAILYFGAAFTRQYVQQKGERIYPNNYAVWVEQVEVETKGVIPEKTATTTTTAIQ